MDWRSALTHSQAEIEALRRKRRREQQVLGSFPEEHCFRITVDGVFVKVSDSFCFLLGHERNEFIGKRIDRFTLPSVMDIPRHLDAICHFGLFRGLWVFERPKGKSIAVRFVAKLLPDGLIEVRADPWAEPFAPPPRPYEAGKQTSRI